MATGGASQSGNKQKDKQSLTLEQILDTEQPYEEFSHLDSSELNTTDDGKLKKIQGSLVGLAVGDALGASVEFRPNAYLAQHPVKEMQSGGTWGLQAGQWTDDTSMALCLAASLIVKGKFDAYDQFVRYKRWFRNGYMSSTGKCFDIGKSTREAIIEFEKRQIKSAKKLKSGNIEESSLDRIIGENLDHLQFDVKCALPDSAGNGPLMRLAPIPLFFCYAPDDLSENIVKATTLTHGDKRASDACRYYAALICAAINGTPKKDLIDPRFIKQRFDPPLHADVEKIATTSYKNNKGYEDGIRGKGFVLDTLNAALWAFHTDGGSFENGVLQAVNLGDDTDTTAAIYGALAGAVYGIDEIPDRWRTQLAQGKFIMGVANGLYTRGKKLDKNNLQRSDWPDKPDPNPDEVNTNHTSNRKQDDNTQSSSPQDHHQSGKDASSHSQQKNANSPSHQDPDKNATKAPRSANSANLITEK